MRFEKVLCTGSSGRLGRYVTEDLRGRCALTVLDVKPSQAPGVQYVNASITDFAALKNAFQGQDAVVHLAAIPNPRTAPPDVTFNTNVQGTWNVLQAAEEAGVRRVIVASSDAALGLHYNPPGYGPQYLPIDESHPLRPIEFYSLSKEATETICRSYANRGKLEVLAIRPTHIVFPPEYPELETRGADVQNYHLWTYVSPEDVAQGFRLALESAKSPFQAFYISAADGLNTRPTLEMLRERYGTLPEIRNPHYFRKNPLAAVLDISRARDVLGFEPTSNWRRMFAAAKAA
ncbi:MAG TPA: NAD(P)-dependent oxidoreductase [Casimicrobiaceae bacterium]